MILHYLVVFPNNCFENFEAPKGKHFCSENNLTKIECGNSLQKMSKKNFFSLIFI